MQVLLVWMEQLASLLEQTPQSASASRLALLIFFQVAVTAQQQVIVCHNFLYACLVMYCLNSTAASRCFDKVGAQIGQGY